MDFEFKAVDEVVRIKPIQDERKERVWILYKNKKKNKKKTEEPTQKNTEKKSTIDIYV